MQKKIKPSVGKPGVSTADFIKELNELIAPLQRPLAKPPSRINFSQYVTKLKTDPVTDMEAFFKKLERRPVPRFPSPEIEMEVERKRYLEKKQPKRQSYSSWLKTVAVPKIIRFPVTRIGTGMISGALLSAALGPVIGETAAIIASGAIGTKISGMGFQIIEPLIAPIKEVKKEKPPLSEEQLIDAKNESRGVISSVWKNGSWMMGNIASMASASTITALAMNMLMGEGMKAGLDFLSGNWMGATWRLGKMGVSSVIRTKIYQLLMQKLNTTTIGGATGKAVHNILSSKLVANKIKEGKPIPESARKAIQKVLGDKTPEWVNATFKDLFSSIAKEGVDATAAYALNHQMNRVNQKFEEILQRSPDMGLSVTLANMSQVAQESISGTLNSLKSASGSAIGALQTGISKGLDKIYATGASDDQLQNFERDVSNSVASQIFGPGITEIGKLKEMTMDKISKSGLTGITAKEMAENDTLFSLYEQKDSLEEQLKDKQEYLQQLQTDQIADQEQKIEIDLAQEQIQDLETKLDVAKKLDQTVEEIGGLQVKALKGVEITAIGMPITQKAFSGLFKVAGKTVEYFHKPLSDMEKTIEIVKMSTGKKWIRDIATGRLISQELFKNVPIEGEKVIELAWKAPEQLGDIGTVVGTATALEAFSSGDIFPGLVAHLGKEGIEKAIKGAAAISKSPILQGIAMNWNPFSWKLQAIRTAAKVSANTAEWLAEGEQNMFIEGIGMAGEYFNTFLDTVNIAGIQEKYLGVPKVDLFKIAKRVFLEKMILPTGKTNQEIVNSILGDILWGTVPKEQQGNIRATFESATLSILQAFS